MALYKKHRPETLKDVWGNGSTVRAVQKYLELPDGDRPHSLLFTGPSGCGKTTLARIISHELGCNGRDFAEIDTADFRGIDTIREIKKRMKLMPSSASKCRVWLLDECHMIGRGGDSAKNEAQNALLKALEDTPAHTYFILCTTDPQMLIKTIKSRCTHFQVSTLTEKQMINGLTSICSLEKKRVKKSILETIAENSGGHVREAMVSLGKVMGLNEDDQEEQIVHLEAQKTMTIDLCRIMFKKGNWKEVCKILQNLDAEPESIRCSVAGYAYAILMKSNQEAAFDLLNIFSMKKYVDKMELMAMCSAHINGYALWSLTL